MCSVSTNSDRMSYEARGAEWPGVRHISKFDIQWRGLPVNSSAGDAIFILRIFPDRSPYIETRALVSGRVLQKIRLIRKVPYIRLPPGSAQNPGPAETIPSNQDLVVEPPEAH